MFMFDTMFCQELRHNVPRRTKITRMSQGIVYTATNTASEFHRDDSFVRFLLGPVGPGKSVATCEEIFIRAIGQAPGYDDVRRTRFAVIRNTYPDLKSTTIATWKTWYPEEKFGKIKWDSPIKHHLKFPLEDGTRVDCEVLFIALDSPDDIRKLRSLELTGAFLNEVQYVPYQIFLTCTERVDRYPPKILGAPITWTGVFADSNLPDTDHWIYRKIDAPRPKGYKLYFYKPAVLKVDDIPTDGEPYEISLDGSIFINNSDCDYRWVQNNPDYWLKLVPGRTDEEIKVVLQGEYGMVMDGKPVHPTYNDRLHFSNRIIEYNPAIELGLGFDFGLTPACAINQLTPRGQLLLLDELWTEDMGFRDFIKNIVIPHLDKNYAGWRLNYVAVGDPSGGTPSQTEANTCFQVAREEGMILTSAAASNDPVARRDGLKYFLGKMVDGIPAYSVSIKCPMIRKGLMGAYKYARLKVGGDERYHEKPLKNMYSHSCEAEEYIAMHYSAENKKPPPNPKKPYKIRTGDAMGW